MSLLISPTNMPYDRRNYFEVHESGRGSVNTVEMKKSTNIDTVTTRVRTTGLQTTPENSKVYRSTSRATVKSISEIQTSIRG